MFFYRKKIRIYDLDTKQLVKHYDKGDWYSPGHSNRIFSVKFITGQPELFITGGWDSSVFIWDLRQKKYADAFYGPNISGDSLDYKNNTILAGSHRNQDSLELYDFGKRKKICTIDWNPATKVTFIIIFANR